MPTTEAASGTPILGETPTEEQTDAKPERLVFLREGTVVLRWLFGFLNKRNLPGWTRSPRWPHTLSTWYPKKPKTRFREATLVGIDIDGVQEEDDMPIRFHTGISILGTKDLHHLCHTLSPITNPQEEVIRSYHWAVEDFEYFANNNNRFCFGKHRCISLSDFRERLPDLLKHCHPLILVTHGGYRKKNILQKLNINLNPILTIDTTKAARYPLQEFHDSALKKLLIDFNIPFTNGLLHFAGNDAHFVLRALLMIAAHDARRELQEIPVWVPVFESIARAPIPPMPLSRQDKRDSKRQAKKILDDSN